MSPGGGGGRRERKLGIKREYPTDITSVCTCMHHHHHHLLSCSSSRVLDVGCGVGGTALHMASRYGAFVNGVDLSGNMVDVANGYREAALPGVKHRIQFHKEDASKTG